MSLDPTMKTGLEADNPLIFFAVELVLESESPDVTLRLIDGSIADVTFSGMTFSRKSETYGTVNVPEPLKDGIGDEAPHLTLTFFPPTNLAAADLAAAALQGSPVRVWWGAINRTTGQPIGTPELFFSGEVDQPTLHVGQNSRSVEIDCASVFERLFENDEGIGLTNASHQTFWPGELGFEMVTEVERQLPWGQNAPRPSTVTSGPGSGYYNGGGSGLNISGIYGAS